MRTDTDYEDLADQLGENLHVNRDTPDQPQDPVGQQHGHVRVQDPRGRISQGVTKLRMEGVPLYIRPQVDTPTNSTTLRGILREQWLSLV